MVGSLPPSTHSKASTLSFVSWWCRLLVSFSRHTSSSAGFTVLQADLKRYEKQQRTSIRILKHNIRSHRHPPKAYRTYFNTPITTSSKASTNSSMESVTSVNMAPTVKANIKARARAEGAYWSDGNGDTVDLSHAEFRYWYPAKTTNVLSCFIKALHLFLFRLLCFQLRLIFSGISHVSNARI